MILFPLIAAAASAATPAPACDGKPVLMVVTGITHDRARMIAYARAIAESGLYQKLGGYYLTTPAPLATLEGTPPPGWATIIVRFPCRANAEAFWHSKTYQETIKPLRLNPSAGDYVVQIFPEAPLRADMAGKVAPAEYTARFPADGIAQVAP